MTYRIFLRVVDEYIRSPHHHVLAKPHPLLLPEEIQVPLPGHRIADQAKKKNTQDIISFIKKVNL